MLRKGIGLIFFIFEGWGVKMKNFTKSKNIFTQEITKITLTYYPPQNPPTEENTRSKIIFGFYLNTDVNIFGRVEEWKRVAKT